MEVHRPGTVLACKGRIRDGGKVFFGGAGTKAFCGSKKPKLHYQFALVKNLLQLQMFNDVVPHIVSLALGRDTTGETRDYNILEDLVEKGIARRWVGRRSVVFDGFPTVGWLYYLNQRVLNGQTTTHLGSGGGSFSLIMALIREYAIAPDTVRKELELLGISTELVGEVLRYADSRRVAK